MRTLLIGASIISLLACNSSARKAGPAPVPAATRVDTVTITREVAPPIPEGKEEKVCLSSGHSLAIHLGTNGDTLIGPRRIPLRDLQPGITFEGRYAAGVPWFVKAEPIRFERRTYRKLEPPRNLQCEDLKQVGEHNGVPLFGDLMVLSPLETIYVPVGPGRFQPYRTVLPRRR